MRSQKLAAQCFGNCPDAVGGAPARLRLTKITAKTTTKMV